MRRLQHFIAFFVLGVLPWSLPADELPVLGDSFASYSSLEEEYRLGRAWLRLLRGNARLIDDPLLQDYLESLLFRLASRSDLKDRRLSVTLLDNPTLNAFAVPGGVVGVNGGLFLYAQEEDELASVLAHELAHLSQRHYAQNLEEQRRQLPMQLATMLGGLILAAASDGQAATAAIATSQAATIQQQLAFSRQNEQEADRVGMQTLYQAGFNPHAMPRMFSRMQRSLRFLGENPPEFLLTHPITESRIADSENRAAQYPQGNFPNGNLYALMKIRTQIALTKDPKQLLSHYQQAYNQQASEETGYGLILSAIANARPQLAEQAMEQLLTTNPDSIPYRVAEAEWLLASQRPAQAALTLEKQLELSPGNRPMSRLLAKAWVGQGKYQPALRLLEEQSRRHPQDLHIWLQLADSYGKANQILGVHEAQAEYLLLKGQVDEAVDHLRFALKLPKLPEPARLRVETRIKEAREIKKSLDF